MNERYIYIILTRTNTVVSRVIALVTGDTYTHASVALDRSFSVMYSFGRKGRYNPFNSGFCCESLDKGIFGCCKRLPYAVVQIEMTEEQYQKAQHLIEAYIKNQARYHYNYTGLLAAWAGIHHRKPYRYYCSEFICHFLEKCGVEVKKERKIIRPQELMQQGKLIIEGYWR